VAIKIEDFDLLAGEVRSLKGMFIQLRDLVEGSIASNNLHANAVRTNNIKDDAITANKIIADAITADKIQALAIDSSKIAVGTITSDQIEDGTIVADKIKTGTLTALQISTGTITAGLLKTGGQAFSHNLEFSSTDANTVSWTAGTIKTADETAYSIDAGNTGNMTARTYIYLDKSVSETVLQTSTSYDAPLGDNRIPIATAEDGTNNAIFTVFQGGGGVFISGGMIAAHTISATQLYSSYIVVGGAASDINSGVTTISGGKITANTLVLSGTATDFDYATLGGTKPPTNADHTADIVSAMAYETNVELAKLGTTVISGGYLRTDLIKVKKVYVGGGSNEDIYFEDSGISMYDAGTKAINIYKSGYKMLSFLLTSTYTRVAGGSGYLVLDADDRVLIEAGSSNFNFYTTGTLQLPSLTSAPTAHNGDIAKKTGNKLLRLYDTTYGWNHASTASSGW